MIAQPIDDADRRINIALGRLDTTIRKVLPTCKGDAGALASWERRIEVPVRGPGYISFVITDDAFCGGAHPSTTTMAIVYDLRTGAPVDWTRLLPASLTGKVALTAGMDGTKVGIGTSEDRAACKEAVENTGSDEPPEMTVWPDAKPGSLALPVETLRAQGVQPPLLDAIGMAHGR